MSCPACCLFACSAIRAPIQADGLSLSPGSALHRGCQGLVLMGDVNVRVATGAVSFGVGVAWLTLCQNHSWKSSALSGSVLHIGDMRLKKYPFGLTGLTGRDKDEASCAMGMWSKMFCSGGEQHWHREGRGEEEGRDRSAEVPFTASLFLKGSK